ncbi:hypothetical protein M0804_005360 [Polistes exclamans]|nr:hypothetical protein M0804_005360 [Polistes exclamans]
MGMVVRGDLVKVRERCWERSQPKKRHNRGSKHLKFKWEVMRDYKATRPETPGRRVAAPRTLGLPPH